MLTRKSLSIALASRFQHIEHHIHALLVAMAIVLTCWDIVANSTFAIAFDRFHLDWKVYVGLGLLLVQVVLWKACSLHLRRAESTPLGPLSAEPMAAPQGYQIVPAVSSEDLDELAAYLDAHYPTGFVSDLRKNTRRELYARWHEASPGFAHIVRRTRGKKSRVVGCCILLPITEETFASYRNGLGTPDAWAKTAVQVGGKYSVYFMPSLHFNKGENRKLAAKVLAELFASFAGERVTEPAKTVIVAPIRTKSERANAISLGFEMFRRSKAGFPIWELDGRRLEELSVSGRRTFEVLAARQARGKGDHS